MWTSIDISSKLSLTYGGNVNYYKSVHHPIPTLPVGTGGTLSIFKINQYINSPFNCVYFQIYSLLVQTEEERETFFGKVQEGGPHCNIITWLI